VTRPTDIQVVRSAVSVHPIRTRVPLKFGGEVLSTVTLVHVEVEVEDRRGRRGHGVGETPLNVQWAWPGTQPYAKRLASMERVAIDTARAWTSTHEAGHPLDLGERFEREALPALTPMGMPRLAALVSASATDIAVHDAYGRVHGVDVYDTYAPPWLARDLGSFFADDPETAGSLAGRFPAHVLTPRGRAPRRLLAWHLVGGLDPLTVDDLTGAEPRDGHPVLLGDWIARDGLRCLKVKLGGIDPDADTRRLTEVGHIALATGVEHLSADFNCTAPDVDTVALVLDRLAADAPGVFDRLRYIEQPFPYDLAANPIDVRPLAARRPVFLDESADDWRTIKIGVDRGWNGVALKTCKTQTGAILSAAWAKHHGLSVMVQDLTNPMLAMIPHVRLAAHVGTAWGVEVNATQFYPGASDLEARVHPDLYRRRGGEIDLGTLGGPGFGYREAEIGRDWSHPAAVFER
jgi:L-alanine-DL-glutamate epimerase-like enolase superfamily enzyme